MEKIDDVGLRELIGDMIQLDPGSRKSADDYLRASIGTVFPALFRDLLHDYLGVLTQPTRDTLASYQWQSPHFKRLLVSESDYRIEKLHRELSTILDVSGAHEAFGNRTPKAAEARFTAWPLVEKLGDLGLPSCSLRFVAELSEAFAETLSVLLTSVVSSSAHSCVFTTSKLMALDLLLALSLNTSDDNKLDRILPFVVHFLQDEVPIVRSTAVRVMTQLVSRLQRRYVSAADFTPKLLLVESLTPLDIQVFPEYILPSLRGFAVDPELSVRVAYATCLPTLAECSLRFLQMAQFAKRDLPVANLETEFDGGYHGTYDSALRDIQDLVQEDLAALLVDPNAAVKRALLLDIDKLCSIIGSARSNDIVLSHMITYLNDRDWTLRGAFFDSILKVGAHVGGRSIEDFVLPLIVQALSGAFKPIVPCLFQGDLRPVSGADEEEFIVAKALDALTGLASAGFLTKNRLIETVESAAPLLHHPTIWIRYGVVLLVESLAKSLSHFDVHCFLFPLLDTYLRRGLSGITESELLDKLKPPLPRILYDQLLLLAGQSPAVLADLRDLSLPLSDPSLEAKPVVKKLRDIGLDEDERTKIAALFPFIARASRAKELRMRMDPETSGIAADSPQSAFMPLKMLGVTPHTVFLTAPSDDRRSNPDGLKDAAQGSMIIVSGGRNSMDVESGGRQSPAGFRLRTADQRGRPPRPTTPRRASSDQPGVGSPPRKSNLFPAATEGRPERRSTSLASGSDAATSTFVISTDGRPQNVIPLLEKKMIHFFPPEVNLGKALGDGAPQPTGLVNSGASSTENPLAALRNWKPEGTLVASFHEHGAAINQTRLSPDALFFATCSNDGTVKIWDCARLEQNVTNRARVSLHQGGRVTSIAFCEGSHSIASASTTGSVHISRVECSYSTSSMGSGGSAKYGGLETLRRFDLPEGEYASLLHHYSTDLSSVLVYASSAGSICGMDLRAMERAWKFDVPPAYGMTTALAVDKRHNWFVTGTSSGTMVLWDIRFGLPLKAWTHPSRSRINSLSLDGPLSAGIRSNSAPKVTCTVEGPTSEISVWDLEKGTCDQVFCVIDADNERAEDDMNALYGKGLHALPAQTVQDDIVGPRYLGTKFGKVGGVARVACTPDGRGMISAGADRKIRFWDLQSVEKSYLISTPEVDSPAPRYRLVIEQLPRASPRRHS